MRSIAPGDLSDILELNQKWVPEVGSLTESALEELNDKCAYTAVIPLSDGSVGGFVLVLGPGSAYESLNYRFFSERHGGGGGERENNFTYLDRIVVAGHAKRTGLGRQLYRGVAEFAGSVGSPVVCCEVNVDPPNPMSTAFHAALGFEPVGRQWTYNHTVEVEMLECPTSKLSPSP